MPDLAILEISQLTKFYKGKIEPAVDSVSFSVAESEILGLLGPNGAGKTTIISIISSLLEPSSGKINVCGLGLESNLSAIKSKIGVVAQNIALYDKLTAYENLYYFGSLQGIEKPVIKARIATLLNRLGLENYGNKYVKNFSGGMKRRVNLIAAVLHNPKLLILDEPTAGVDVQTRNVMKEFLLELKEQGTSMIYTSHQLEDVEQLCDRICIIDHGKILVIASPEELIASHADHATLEDVFIHFTGTELRDK